MPVKRRNHGRQKKNRGSVNVIQCVQCGAIVPKDKAISRTSNKPVIENATLDDLNVATIYESPEVPTMSITENHCVSCACHLRVVRTRNKDSRREKFTPRIRAE
ncbi:small subunit ribosomal protein S26e [Pancytospora epiphaga]|nr:small subunit ribosomal protein S26e [Pancytospora epiphaga]